MKSDKFINHLVRRLKWDDLDENYIFDLVRTARAEDIEGAGLREKPQKAIDITTATITPHSEIKSFLVARRDMVMCGIKLIPMILKVYEPTVNGESCVFTPFVNDGDRVAKGGQIGEISGSARIILQAERIMLNFIQRLSGVATVTAEYVKALGDSQTKLLDTRKTTPCLRVLEKIRVRVRRRLQPQNRTFRQGYAQGQPPCGGSRGNGRYARKRRSACERKEPRRCRRG